MKEFLPDLLLLFALSLISNAVSLILNAYGLLVDASVFKSVLITNCAAIFIFFAFILFSWWYT